MRLELLHSITIDGEVITVGQNAQQRPQFLGLAAQRSQYLRHGAVDNMCLPGRTVKKQRQTIEIMFDQSFRSIAIIVACTAAAVRLALLH